MIVVLDVGVVVIGVTWPRDGEGRPVASGLLRNR